ncbi:MAG: hypothetical protein EA420_05500 [Candidatus Competibacteraceae bacterium]|nr:MAG: hypothetical protein EA420_05500 [Candidatus Competibacteraceae bacterium]
MGPLAPPEMEIALGDRPQHNTFDKAIGGAEGGNARPNVLLGHWPLAGPGAERRMGFIDNAGRARLTKIEKTSSEAASHCQVLNP